MQTELEKKAILERDTELAKNTEFNFENEYSDQEAQKGSHTTSMGHAKGSIIDTQKGGSEIDINGNKNIPFSGRKGNLAINIKYGKDNGYSEEILVDTSKNQGQVKIY